MYNPNFYEYFIKGAFANSKIKKFIAPKVEYIGDCAFANSDLETIVAPKTKEIGNHSFEITNIQSVDFPECEKIGDFSFAMSTLGSAVSKEKKFKFLELKELFPKDHSFVFDIDYALEDGDYYTTQIKTYEYNSYIHNYSFAYCAFMNGDEEIITGYDFGLIISDSNNNKIKSVWMDSDQIHLNINESSSGVLEYYHSMYSSISLVLKYSYDATQKLFSIYADDSCHLDGMETLNEIITTKGKDVIFPKCTTVGKGAFYKSQIYNISLPEVVEIDTGAFNGCNNLQSINIPKVKNISSGEYGIDGIDGYNVIGAFNKCSSLEEIHLPECISIEGRYTFLDCDNLRIIDAPKITTIPSGLFTYNRPDSSYGTFFTCKNLSKIIIPECTEFNEYLYGTVIEKILGEEITDVSLAKVLIGADKITQISNAFCGMDNIKRVNLSKIESFDNTFRSCKNLQTVNLPDCKYLYSAFSGCENLTSINIPNCEQLGQDTFYNCNKLTTITLPNCTHISYYCFAECSSLTSIYLTSDTLCTFEYGIFGWGVNTYPKIFYVPYSLYNDYVSTYKDYHFEPLE